jgi:hypothetical protein
MLEHLFDCIKQRILTRCPEIKDVRVYNGQDVFSDEHVPFQSPTVFIDFTSVDYDTIGYKYQKAVVEIRSMLFHEAMTLNHLEVFSLNSKLNSYLNVWGEWGATLERDSGDTDTNFDRLYVMNTNYITTFEESTVPDGSRIPIGQWPENTGVTGKTNWDFAVTGYSESEEIAFEFETQNTYTEDFEEVPTVGFISTAFTSNDVSFNTGDGSYVAGPIANIGYDASSFYVECRLEKTGPDFTETLMKTDDGSLFSLESMWVYISNNLGTFAVVPGEVELHWFKDGNEILSKVFSLPGQAPGTNTGYNEVNIKEAGLSGVFADEIKITSLGDIVYTGIDHLTWTKGRY